MTRHTPKMSQRRVSILIVMASLLMMLQCCSHVCVCDNGDISADDEDSDLTLEVEDEETDFIDIFEPTKEWKPIKEGQAIPAGLHVRMNMQTGENEARLMPDSDTDDTASTKDGENSGTDETRDIKTPQNMPTSKETPTDRKRQENTGPDTQPHPGFIFRGDQRRAHHYGHSDRRGIINKRRRVFTQKEVAEALKQIDESNADLTKLPSIAYTKAASGEGAAKQSQRAGDVTTVQQDRPTKARLEKQMHQDLVEMMEHTKTLTRQAATVSELLQALEELEYHVHHIENARELNTIGGLVVVVRLLNHTHPDVRSSAAHVIGAATQSNPQVQSEVLDYGALELLCQFITPREPELVQRRGLFALSALLRGQTQPQLVFMQECRGLLQLGHNFHQRTMPTQLKIITLLTDLLREQELLLHDSEELKSLLYGSVQEHGWCQHVSSLLHSDAPSPTEKALQAMHALQHLCDFTSHLARLQELNQQFEEAVLREEDEVSLSLLKHSQDLLKNIRNRNREL